MIGKEHFWKSLTIVHQLIAVTTTNMKPSLSKEAVPSIVHANYGLNVVEVSQLDSYDDQNFKVVTDQGENFVLKVSNSEDSNIPQLLEETNRLLIFCHDNGVPVPAPIVNHSNPSGVFRISIDNSNTEFAIRLMKYIPGTLLMDIPLTEPVLEDIGKNLALSTKVVSQFKSKVLESRDIVWSLLNIDRLHEFLSAVTDEKHRSMVLKTIEAFEKTVQPHVHCIPSHIIHSDWNEANILVNKGSTDDSWYFSGIIDFGDVHFAPRIFDLASLILYMILICKIPMDVVARSIIQGYSTHIYLDPLEKQVLPFCVCARLVQSLTVGAFSLQQHPENEEYLSRTSKNGWQVLESLLHQTNHLSDKWFTVVK